MRVTGRALVRVGGLLTAVPVVLVLTAPAGAAAPQRLPLADLGGETSSFGLLGPVGVIAVVLGLVGMVAGTVRHLRRSRAEAAAQPATEYTEVVEPVQQSAVDTAQRHN